MGSIFPTHTEIKVLASGTDSGAVLAHTSPQYKMGKALASLKANCPKQDSTGPQGCGSVLRRHWRISGFVGHLYSLPMGAAAMRISTADGGAQIGAEKWKPFHLVVRASINQHVKWTSSPRAGVKFGAQKAMSERLIYLWRILFLLFSFFSFFPSFLSLSRAREGHSSGYRLMANHTISVLHPSPQLSKGYTFLEIDTQSFMLGIKGPDQRDVLRCLLCLRRSHACPWTPVISTSIRLCTGSAFSSFYSFIQQKFIEHSLCA